MKIYEPVKPDVSIPEKETETLDFWNREKIFEKSLEQTKGKKTFSFYDGPPFATGLPHYGHLLAGTLKDIVPRYWTMKGYHVRRVFGWDCHGLPVEFEIDKALKIDNRKQVFAMGVDKYNAQCKSIVTRYTGEWKKTVQRIGRWVDMENAYFTMNPKFMQSVWWVFQQMWDKGLVYEGYKVVPYSTGCSTPLSNFEANLNYKDVQDPAITVAFQINRPSHALAHQLALMGPGPAFVLAWTTTPWTLPSNLALAVGKDFNYILIRHHETSHIYLVAEALAVHYKKELGLKDEWIGKNGELNIPDAETIKGSDLLATASDPQGTTYEPLFPYFATKFEDKGTKENRAFKIIASDHVTTESGTGIVHMAPAFGEDDFIACKKELGEDVVVNPVDDDGMYTEEITKLNPEYGGKRVTDEQLNKDIIHRLKNEHKLIKNETYQHSYPFCWRSDTKLIYRAVSTWFVRVEQIKETMVAANKKTNWVPDHLRDGRFGNWLDNARDWAISRNRFWGTPIPVWRNKEGEMICIGSIADLEKFSGKAVTDLHIESVDPIEIPRANVPEHLIKNASGGKSPFKRTEGVLDCWFESGSMPYAEIGYPFGGKDGKEKIYKDGELPPAFPANFIAEGLDQTRGWFYTLTVIGAALYGRSPFENVVVNGLVLAEDGKKMSKSLRNYPDPNELINQFGADALRLYMIDSPVVKAQELRFSEKGVRDVVRRIMLRWWNSYSFFVNYANIDDFKPKGDAAKSPNILDQWILSKLNTLTEHTNQEMSAYRLYNVVPGLLQFIEELTNTYIRFNRRHFWKDGMPEDKRLAYETLYEVLTTLSRLMAPFAPFMADTIYMNLSKVKSGAKASVHLESYPQPHSELKKPKLEEAVSRMEVLTMLGRNLREKFNVKGKIPLKTLKVIHRDEAVLSELKKLESYFVEELNVREVIYDTKEDSYVEITAKANFPALGKRLGPKMKQVAGGIQKLSLADILKLETGAALTIEGEEITRAEVEVRRSVKTLGKASKPPGAASVGPGDNVSKIAGPGKSILEETTVATDPLITIELDPTVTPEQEMEGFSREIIRRVQIARKSADFNLDDRIHLEIACEGKLREAFEAHLDRIKGETLALSAKLVAAPKGEFTESADVDGDPLGIGLQRTTN